MKILIVNKFHYLRGGDCRYAFELSALLQKEGHTVRHFSMQHPNNIPSEHQEYFVSYVDFPRELKKKGIASKLRVFFRILYSKEARIKFGKLLDDFHPDIIHLNNIHKHLTTSIIIEANKRGIPIVWTLHDYNLICPNISFLADNKVCEQCRKFRYISPVMKRCSNKSLAASTIIAAENMLHRYQRIEKRIDYFISPSEFLKNKFVEFGYHEHKIKVLPNFSTAKAGNENKENEADVITNAEDRQHRHWEKLDEPLPNRDESVPKYFLYLGRLSREKGIETLCKAAQSAGVSLLIAGDGPLRNELEPAYGSDNIKFVGHIEGAALEYMRKNAWFLVIPSEWYENNPYSVIESFNDGVPVIGANIGGIPELVIEGKTGFLFDHGDAEKLRQLLLYADDLTAEERNLLGINAKEQVAVRNNPEHYYTELMKIYNNAITEGRQKWKHLLQ